MEIEIDKDLKVENKIHADDLSKEKQERMLSEHAIMQQKRSMYKPLKKQLFASSSTNF
jgi:hypothetical protein